MKQTLFTILFVTSFAATFLASCKKETSCEGCGADNKPPIAVAGSNQQLILPLDSILLDGSLSKDPDGKITAWRWTKISGPASLSLQQYTAAKTMVRQLAEGIYLFELMVTDDNSASATDTVQITVDAVGTINRPPVACAGADQTITLPVATITLNGSCSIDPENNITTYQWTKIAGPSAYTIANADVELTAVSNLAEGTYLFELKVTDAGGLFSLDTVQVTVNNANMAVDIYVAGEENGVAKYWKNGVPVTLPGSTPSVARSIVVAGTDVYVAGVEGNFVNNTSRAKYWKNGQEIFLTGATGAVANSIIVVGSDVYVAGYENDVAKYWKNGQAVSLGNGQNFTMASCIFVVGPDVYVTGMELIPNAPSRALYWKNGQPVLLSGGFYASSITVTGSDVYVAGYQPVSGLATESKYWKNGQPVSLTNGLDYSNAASITLAGSDVYIAGYDGRVAKYWKNGQSVSLSNGLKFATATSITTFGADVYVAGHEAVSNTVSIASYWKNGQAITLSNGTGKAYANSIFVAP
jgi:hypothetical protein